MPRPIPTAAPQPLPRSAPRRMAGHPPGRDRAPRPPAAGRRRLARRLVWPVLRWVLILGIWGALAGGLLLLWFARDLPRPEEALDAARRPGLTLEDRAGRSFATFGDVVGDSLSLSQMPRALPAAAVAVEDRRFWSHFGIDLVGMARAAWVDLRARHIVQGGSTITQQVAKNLFLTSERTFRRKIQELMLTLWLEHSFTKRQILEIWLNRVYLGSGAYGVDAAARLYFGVSARHVPLWQAAMLAGIPRAPSRFNPRANPEAAVARTKEVLAAMVADGAITAAQAREAASRISIPDRPATAGWFADWAAERAQSLLPPNQDAVLRTTLDPRMQSVVEQQLAALLDGPGVAAGAGEGAAVVLDAATGAVRAMAGGRDWRATGFNRATLALRQPGSSFKPFVWLAALEHGARPDDKVLDAPIDVNGWKPVNFERRFLGEITLEHALAESVNTASVRLEMQAGGPRAVAAVAHRLGIAETLPADPSLALGTGEVRLLEMAGAYASFFNGGWSVVPYGIQSARAGGAAVALPALPHTRVIDPDLAAMMVRMMTAVVQQGTGRAAAIPGRNVAGKTGTTQDYRDAWFIGATNGLVIAVWVGNDDNRPMRDVTGGTLPAKLFHDIAARLH